MVTLKDIAREAGVHKTTVSKILIDPTLKFNLNTRQRVQQIALRMGYRPNAVARALTKGKTHTIGVVAHLSSLGSIQLTERVEAIAEEIQNARYKMTLVSRRPNDVERERDHIEDLLTRRVDGLMIFNDPVSDTGYYESLAARGMPLVLFGAISNPKRLPTVFANTTESMCEITRYLLGLGHREIAYLVGRDALRSPIHRAKGFLRAFDEAGIRPRKGWLLEEEAGEFDLEAVQRFTERTLSQSPRPTAICFADDDAAMAGLQTIFKMGLRVPEDISVVGFNDSALSRMTWPPLTTVAQPKERMAQEAMRLLLLQMEGRMDEAETHVWVNAECVIRQSTGPVPARVRKIYSKTTTPKETRKEK